MNALLLAETFLNHKGTKKAILDTDFTDFTDYTDSISADARYYASLLFIVADSLKPI
jgi:hypothetical protein